MADNSTGAVQFTCSNSCTATCPPHFYCPSMNGTAAGFSSFNVIPCGPGFYCPGGSHFDRVACAAGSLCDRDHLSAPLPCPTGSSCIDPAASPIRCAAGNFCTGGIQAVCPTGSLCPQAGLTAPLTCPTGYLCPSPVLSPVVCLAGSFCLKSVQIACPSRSYCPTNATLAPLSCPMGTFCPESSVAPLDCSAGSFCSGGIKAACPVGTRCDQDRLSAPLRCPTGFGCLDPAASPIQCAAGNYCTGGLQVACSTGSLCNQPELAAPLTCPDGYLCLVPAASPTKCPADSICTDGTHVAPAPLSPAPCEDPSASISSPSTPDLCCPIDRPFYFTNDLWVLYDPTAPINIRCVIADARDWNWCVGSGANSGSGVACLDPYTCRSGGCCPHSGLCVGGQLISVTVLTATRAFPTVCSCGGSEAQTMRNDSTGAVQFTCSNSCTATCPPHFYCPSMSGASAGSSSFNVIPCGLGYYCPGGRHFDRLACPGGAYCPSDTTTSPSPCPIGSVCPLGSVDSQICPAFHLCPRVAMSVADPCPAGHACSSKLGSTESTGPCEAGSYDDGSYPPTCQGSCGHSTWLWRSGQTSCVFTPAAIVLIVFSTLFFVLLCLLLIRICDPRCPAVRAAKAHKQEVEMQALKKKAAQEAELRHQQAELQRQADESARLKRAEAERIAESHRQAALQAERERAATQAEIQRLIEVERLAAERHRATAQAESQRLLELQRLADLQVRASSQLSTMRALRSDIVQRMVLEVTAALRSSGVPRQSPALTRFAHLLTSAFDSALLLQPSGFNLLSTLALHQDVMPPADLHVYLRAGLLASAMDKFDQCAAEEIRKQQQEEKQQQQQQQMQPGQVEGSPQLEGGARSVDADLEAPPSYDQAAQPQQLSPSQQLPFTTFESRLSLSLQRDFSQFSSSWLLNMQQRGGQAREQRGLPMTPAQMQQIIPREYQRYSLTVEQKMQREQQQLQQHHPSPFVASAPTIAALPAAAAATLTSSASPPPTYAAVATTTATPAASASSPPSANRRTASVSPSGSAASDSDSHSSSPRAPHVRVWLNDDGHEAAEAWAEVNKSSSRMDAAV